MLVAAGLIFVPTAPIHRAPVRWFPVTVHMQAAASSEVKVKQRPTRADKLYVMVLIQSHDLLLRFAEAAVIGIVVLLLIGRIFLR